MSLQALASVPENVVAAADVVKALDRCFLIGFGRLSPEQHQMLQSLQRIFAGTPLAVPVEAAVSALSRSEFVDRHFVTLAAARAALQAAQYDALRTQVNAALGRPAPAAQEPPPAQPAATGPIQTWQESARNWLRELALAGFEQMEAQTLSPFFATLEQLQGEPRTLRLAALLTGFLNELLASLPVSALPAIPVYRWADLWTRAMLASSTLPAPVGRKVSGQLTFLGADLHAHDYFVSCDFYALLEPKGEPARQVRLTLGGYKVDVLNGSEIWSCLPDAAEDPVLGLSRRLCFTVNDMTLLPGGELLWDGKAGSSNPVPFLDAAKKVAPGIADAPVPLVCAPVDRHPVQLAETVFLGPYKVKKVDEAGRQTLMLELADAQLPVAMSRLSSASEISHDKVTASSNMLGLLRFDGGRWEVLPLAVSIEGKKPEVVFTGSGATAARTGKNKTLATLKERASKLLRQKS